MFLQFTLLNQVDLDFEGLAEIVLQSHEVKKIPLSTCTCAGIDDDGIVGSFKYDGLRMVIILGYCFVVTIL